MTARTSVAIAAFIASASLAACGDGSTGGRNSEANRRRPAQTAGIIAAIAPRPGGGALIGELATGSIRDLVSKREIASVNVGTGGQRGLLGLAIDLRGRVFAAATGRDRRLRVIQVAPGRQRTVWLGPRSTTLANGGHLAFAPDGNLVIGVGDLQDPARTPDPQAPNGKLLALDPDGPADQRPKILSRGWNNPYAFAFDPHGRLWVADNAPGKRPERIARADTRGGPPADETQLAGARAPSGMAFVSDSELVLCGVVSGRLDRFHMGSDGRWRPVGTVAGGCRYGVARLRDGRLAVSRDKGVRTVSP